MVLGGYTVVFGSSLFLGGYNLVLDRYGSFWVAVARFGWFLLLVSTHQLRILPLQNSKPYVL